MKFHNFEPVTPTGKYLAVVLYKQSTSQLICKQRGTVYFRYEKLHYN